MSNYSNNLSIENEMSSNKFPRQQSSNQLQLNNNTNHHRNKPNFNPVNHSISSQTQLSSEKSKNEHESNAQRNSDSE